jgi:hypothetical protein
MYPEGHENRHTFEIGVEVTGCGAYTIIYGEFFSDGVHAFVFDQDDGPMVGFQIEVGETTQLPQEAAIRDLEGVSFQLCDASPYSCIEDGSCTATLVSSNKIVCEAD